MGTYRSINRTGKSRTGETINDQATGRTCLSCNEWKPRSYFYVIKQRNTLYPYCDGCRSERGKAKYKRRTEESRQRNIVFARNRRERARTAVLEAYGSKCACCGETRRPFLTLDHVNNDGAAHRKAIGRGLAIYLDVIKQEFPENFQLLCWNCNVGKQINGGVCPHEREA